MSRRSAIRVALKGILSGIASPAIRQVLDTLPVPGSAREPWLAFANDEETIEALVGGNEIGSLAFTVGGAVIGQTDAAALDAADDLADAVCAAIKADRKLGLSAAHAAQAYVTSISVERDPDSDTRAYIELTITVTYRRA